MKHIKLQTVLLTAITLLGFSHANASFTQENAYMEKRNKLTHAIKLVQPKLKRIVEEPTYASKADVQLICVDTPNNLMSLINLNKSALKIFPKEVHSALKQENSAQYEMLKLLKSKDVCPTLTKALKIK